MLNNSTTTFIISLLVFGAVLFLLYKAYQKKKRKPIFTEEKPNIFNPLGENEASSSRNEHFIFPEKNTPMKEATSNKFRVAKEIEEEIESRKKKDEKKTQKEPSNEIEKLKKDFKGEIKKDRGFVFDAQNSILSHEILKKRVQKNRQK